MVVISDFYEQPEIVIKTIEPLRYRGNDLILFHVLDPQEIRPKLKEPSLLVDMETEDAIEVSPEYARKSTAPRSTRTSTRCKTKAAAAGIDYQLLPTDRPLDDAMREYFVIRKGRM